MKQVGEQWAGENNWCSRRNKFCNRPVEATFEGEGFEKEEFASRKREALKQPSLDSPVGGTCWNAETFG